jgi:hypothetical protein
MKGQAASPDRSSASTHPGRRAALVPAVLTGLPAGISGFTFSYAEGGASGDPLAEALALQRKAQFRLDFVAAENSRGFHAPQEAARILAEAIDDARRGQVAALGAK